jgi:hypothetical protein
VEASADAILLFDGVFLLRPELVDVVGFRVFITVASQEAIRRGRVRDAVLYGSPDEAERRYLARYLPSGTAAAQSGQANSPPSYSRTTTRPGRAYSCGAEIAVDGMPRTRVMPALWRVATVDRTTRRPRAGVEELGRWEQRADQASSPTLRAVLACSGEERSDRGSSAIRKAAGNVVTRH